MFQNWFRLYITTSSFNFVPRTGLEPAPQIWDQHLKLACLPIPPPRHIEGWIWLNYIFSPTYTFEMWIYEFIPWQPSFPPLGDLLSIYPYLQYVKERMRLSSLDFKDTIFFSFFKKKLHLFFCTPSRIWTYDPQIRNLLLYPVELSRNLCLLD